MKRKIFNLLSAAVLTASLTMGILPAEGLKVQAAGDINETVQSGLIIKESEINKLLTEDLELPATVDGLDGAAITYTVQGQPPAGNHGAASVDGNTLKVTRPYAGEGNYKFNLVATVEAGDATATKTFPMIVREGLSGDSYAGYVYVCFSEGKGKNSKGEDYDVQQVHFFLSEDGLNWTALNGCQPAFLAGSDYLDGYLEKCGPTSVNYQLTIEEDEIKETAVGDASVLFPFEGRDQGIRDPYLLRGSKADGSDANKVWLLATDLNLHSANYGPASNMANNICGDWSKTAVVGTGSTHLFVWETEDWVHWERRYIDVGSQIDAGMAWAPEAIYNPEKDNYLVYWSGKVDADNITRNRLYCCETSDFKEFGPTKLYEQEPFYLDYKDGANENDGYGNIDTSQLWVAGKDKNGNDTPYGTLFRVVKDETLRNNGKALLNVQLMSADSVLDPAVDYDDTEPVRITPYEYQGITYESKDDFVSLTNDKNNLGKAEIVYNWFKNESTGNHFEKIPQSTLDGLKGEYYEGATMFKFIDRDEWCVMIDHYAGSSKPRYEPFVTTDLSEENSITKMPQGTYGREGGDVGCHGGMIPITVDEYNTMVKYYNDKNKMVDMNEAAANNYHEISLIQLDARPMNALAEKLENTAKGSNYSAGTKAQMANLAVEAKKLGQKTNLTDTAEMDKLTARAEKLMANTLVAVPQMYADHVELSDTELTLCTKATEGLQTKTTLLAEVDVDDAPKGITWVSSNPDVAAVANGVVTAKKAGTATITATAVGGAKAVCQVTVKGVPSKITIKKKSVSLKKKKKYQIKPGIPKGTVCSTFKYKSNKPKIASVSKEGLVTAKKKGTAKITITAGNNSKAKATLTVKVK